MPKQCSRKKARRRREELDRNAIIASANFLIAGVNHEGRAAVIARYAQPGDTVFLVRDRANVYSRNAIEVRLSNGMQIGYVPENYRRENYAERLAPLLDSGCRHTAEITKILDQGRPPIPVVDVSIYRNVATVRAL